MLIAPRIKLQHPLPAWRQAGWAALSVALAAALVALLLAALGRAAPAEARLGEAPAAAQLPPLAPASDTLSMTMHINTGTGDDSFAYNGQVVTYTIRITNNSFGLTANNIWVTDLLPPDTLSDIACQACEHIVEEQTIPEPLGGMLVITITRQLSWTLPSLPPGATTELVITGRVVGQADGTVFKNSAFAAYSMGDNPAVIPTNTNETATTVRVLFNALGQPAVATAPTWFSGDVGGTLSQDWGDFNNDGYLDLVLASSVGTSVYRNELGLLKPFWNNTERAYGVRWADVNGDGRLDLVTVGDSQDGTAVTAGINRVFVQVTDERRFVEEGTFLSEFQYVRLALGDFDGDGDVDLIASTNTLNAECPVRLHRNNGAGVFATPGECISAAPTAALAAADFDNDGDLDLAIGRFPNTIQVLRNNGSGAFPTALTVDANVPFLPYDFSWGDFDGNGFMDLAAAFPLQKEARVYRNLGGVVFDTPLEPFRTARFLSPLAVDWGDFSGDGRLDLLVADEEPKVYVNSFASFDTNNPVKADALTGQVWSVRGAQVGLGGDLDISLTNRDQASYLIEGFAPHLAPNLTIVDTTPASSLAWGDLDGDGDLDLVLGAGPTPALGTRVLRNTAGSLGAPINLSSGLGPQSVVVGDVNGDARLDIAIGTALDNRLYAGLPGPSFNPVWSSFAPSFPVHVLAFGDANSDGRLDLLVGANGGGVAVYLNTNGVLGADPVFVTPETGDVRAVAWGDFNRDFHLDFAVAFYNQPARVYLNNKNNTFTAAWDSGAALPTTSLAVADFNGDSYPDLALGHYGHGVHVFENRGAGFNGQLSAAPVWTSPTQWRTTALAWGDWDNNGYPDLAVGNDNDPNQVFANLGSAPGTPRLFWLWTAAETFATTGVAWGDYDGDGDLDLGVSSKAGAGNGFYVNGGHTPAHLSSDFVPTLALPNNPTYLSVDRPGQTPDAYYWSASEFVGGISQPVTITYTLFDPDGSRVAGNTNAAGNPIARTYFEYSLDGGSTWKTASAAAGWTGPVTTTTRLGTPGIFLWDALKDKAISDDARFRVRVVPRFDIGPVQRASSAAISPPFRIRATTCIWPENPFMLTVPTVVTPNVATTFIGGVGAGTGALTYTWNFGGSPVLGQVTQHTFPTAGIYSVTLTVTGQPCPQNRPVAVTKYFQVGSPVAQHFLYLPLLMNNVNGGQTVGDTEPTATPTETATETPTPTDTPTDTPTPTETPTETPTPEASPSAEPPTATPTDEAEATPTEPPSGLGLPGLGALGGWSSSLGLGAPALGPGLAPLAAPITPSQVTTATPGINNEPALNADGTRMAFWSTADPLGENPDGNIEVFLLIDHGGGVEIRQVTHSTGSILGGFNLSPSIDDAGDRVVFFSDRDLTGENPDNNFEVFLYDVPGDTLHQVTNTDRGFNILPSISGSGEYIAFASDRNFTGGNPDGNTEIFRARLEHGGTFSYLQVTDSTGGVNDSPRISQDGARIAFVANHNYPVANAPINNADNNREVFLAVIGPPVTLVQLTNTNSGFTGGPAINGDGTRVAFVSDRDPTGGGGNPNNRREIYYANISPGLAVSVVQVTNSVVELGNDQPSISADGTRIAFTSPALGQVRMWDTLLADEFVSSLGVSLAPFVSSDGTALAFAFDQQLYLTSSPMAEVMVSKSAAPQPVYEGQPLVYTIVISNAGPSAAANVRVTETLPTGGYDLGTLQFSYAGNGVCVYGQPITCTVALLPARSAITLTVGLTPTVFGPLTNTVQATTDTFERLVPNTTTLVVAVQPIPLESVSVEVSGPPTGTAHIPAEFIASVSPVTASVPLTYVWEASGQATQTFTSTSVTEAVSFAWNPGGVQVVTVTVSNAAAPVVSDTHTITIFNPLPTLGALIPPTRTINTAGFTLVVTGTGFVANSQALWDGAPLTTTYVNSATLNVTVPDTLLTQLGGHTVAVSNTTPGGGLSNALTFTVNNPAPTLTNHSPLTAVAGGPTFTLRLTGTNFVTGALLHWDGLPPLATTGSGTSLTATVPASYISTTGSVPISVTNPAPSNGPSNTRQFTVTALLLDLRPNAASIGLNESVVLTAEISAVQAQDTFITITSSLTDVATAPPGITIPAGFTSTTFTVQGGAVGGQSNIIGQLPAAVGGAADITIVSVNYPAPTLTAISPVTATAGGLTFTLTLTGSDFVSGAQVAWGGLPPLPAFGSGTSLTATIPANYISTTGSVNVVVNNPLPNFGPSASRPFTVTPLNITLTPNPLTVGFGVSPVLTITVNAVQAEARVIAITDTAPFITTPPTVTLPAGDLSVPFTLTVLGRGGTAVVTATLPAAQGGNAATATVTINNPAPVLTEVTPLTGTVLQPDLTLTLTGTNFVSNSEVRWSTTTLTQTGFVSSQGLTATVPPGLLTPAGDYTVTVANPGPGGGVSAPLTVTLVHALPTVITMTPTSAQLNAPAFTLVVTGTGFVPTHSVIYFGGAPYTTNFVSTQRLTATISSAALDTPGQVTVTVVTAPPGGGMATPPLTFTIQTLSPFITALTPPTRTVNSGTFALTVSGGNFVNPAGTSRDSEVRWYNGVTTSTLSTTFINSTTLTATVTNAHYPTAGVYTVTVFNPDPPGGIFSNSRPFTVENPLPLTSVLTPSQVTAGSADFVLLVGGANFINGASVVLWDGNPLTTVFISSGVLQANVPAALVETPAWVSVTVQTSGPGGGTSAPPLPFAVAYPPATLTARSPATGVVLSNLTLYVTGTNTVPGTMIRWNSTILTGTEETITGTFKVDVPQALYPVGGVYTVTLVSPEPPLGGTPATNVMTVTMLNPQPIVRVVNPPFRVAGTEGFTLTVDANPGEPNYFSGVQGYFNGQPRTTVFISSTQLQMGVLQADVAEVGAQIITVTNPSPAVGPSEVFTYNVIAASLTITPSAPPFLVLPATRTLTATFTSLQANPTVITLTSSNPLSVSVPPTVIRTGTNLTAPFVVTGNLTGTVVITAQLPTALGGTVATATVTFRDAAITGLSASNNSPTTLGQPTTLTASVTAGTNISYSWVFGDGTASGFTTTNPITHVYPLTTTGTFTASLTARNSVGTTSAVTTVVTIHNKPVIQTISPLTLTQDITETVTVTGTGGTFLPGALVEIQLQSGGAVTTYTTIYIDANRLTFEKNGAHFPNPGAFNLYVVNPPPPVAAAPRRSDPFPFNIQ